MRRAVVLLVVLCALLAVSLSPVDVAGRRHVHSHVRHVRAHSRVGDAPAMPFAPYIDVQNNQDLVGIMNGSGVKHLTLAFITSKDYCTASWEGYQSLDSNFMQQSINDFRAAGGDIIISFGGAAGNELARSCNSVEETRAQYQAVIDKYGVSYIDFDVESTWLNEQASVERRNQAITQLRGPNGQQLHISFTIPVAVGGLTGDGMTFMKRVVDAGITPAVVNVMTMDYGDDDAPNPDGQMGMYVIDSGMHLHDQLTQLFPSKSDSDIWRMIGITPDIGVGDVASEKFYVSDAQQLVQWAQSKQIGRLAFWQVTRDNSCDNGRNLNDDTCSGVGQGQYDFAHAFNQFQG